MSLQVVTSPYTRSVTEVVPAFALKAISPHITLPSDDFPWPVTPSKHIDLN